MATFGNVKELKIGDDGIIILNEPTIEDWNRYYNGLTKIEGRGKKAKALNTGATAADVLFDKVFASAENVTVYDNEQGEEVPLSKETLHLVPARRKTDCITAAFMRDNSITGETDEEEVEESHAKKS